MGQSVSPQTKALSHWPFRNAVNAESIANIPLLHAVSTQNDGPTKPKQYEILWIYILKSVAVMWFDFNRRHDLPIG